MSTAKPWEKPAFLKPGPMVYMPADLDGVLELVAAVTKVNEWRRKEWKKLHPGNDSAIDDEINLRNRRLSSIEKFVADCKRNVDSTQAEFIFDLINCGMVIQHEVYAWAINASEKGALLEEGLDKSKKARGITQQEWIERKQKATSSMKEHNNNKIKVAKSLGIKPSTLENWLRGGRREKK